MGSPVLFGANNLANNLQNGELLANGTLLSYNGPKNYIQYSSFENGLTTGWSLGTVGTLTNGIPTGTPTFGSGASGNLSISTVSSGQLSGNYSLSYVSSAATTQGNMLASQVYNIDAADQAKVLTYKCYYSVFSGAANGNFSGTSSNSFGIAVYDVTNSSWLSLAGNFAMTQNSGVGYATGTCQTNSNTTQIRFVLYNANATSGAITLYLDDFFLGPQTAPYGPVITDWQSYTLAIGGSTSAPTPGTVAYNTALWRRVGGSVEIIYQFSQTGAGSAGSGQYLFPLPPGLVADTTKVNVGSPVKAVGYGFVSSGTDAAAVVWLNSSTNLSISTAGTGTVGSTYVPLSGATAQYAFEAFIPIAGWSSNVQMSSDSSTAVVDFKGTNASTQAVTANVTNLAFTAIKDSNGAWNGTQYQVPVTGDYAILLSASDSSTNTYNFRAYVNGVADAYIATTNSGHYGSGGTVLTGLKAGDLISVRTDNSQTVGANPYLAIFRLSGPAVVAANESVNMSYTDTSGATVGSSPATYTYATKVYDSHNAYSSGTYTIPVQGKYRVSASLAVNTTLATTTNLSTGVYQNGTKKIATAIAGNGAGSSQIFQAILTGTLNCLAGDAITIQPAMSTGTQAAYSGAGYNYLSIERVGN